MKISINYLKKYLNFELPAIDVLVERIGTQLGALEEGVIDLWEIYNQVIVSKVIECNPIEGSDHLSLCKIDDGRKHTDDSIRDEKGYIQVVCGANNVAEGQMVAWLPPKSIVPSSFFKDKLILESKELQGKISHGMIASSHELLIDDDHSGILLIDVEASPGDSFAKLYELDDYIIDIENKMFTHRPDCFGMIGIARELSGILNQPFSSPDWYKNDAKINSESSDLIFKIENEIPSLVPRFSAISMDKVGIKKSPILIRSYLSRLGVRPVNSIVDATNICMIETGQPLHAYDYDKLKSLTNGDEVTFTIRNPKSGEKIELINDKTIEPSSNSIVIACNQPVGLGGIMGATNSAITDDTKSIVIEAASFDMYSIRRTSMELGIFSDAVTRFTKGQSPLQTTRVLVRAIELIKQLSGNDVVVAFIADNNNLPEATIKRDSLTPEIKVGIDFINNRLGTTLSSQDAASLLGNVECLTEADDSEIDVSAPFWRTDLEIREDVVEEVGRLQGYDKIEKKPLLKSLKPSPVNSDLARSAKIRQILSSAGANEVLTYSFVSKKLLSAAGQDIDKAYQLSNPLSPDVEYYRLSLLPSLLGKVNMNIKAGYLSFSMFEMGSSWQISQPDPLTKRSLALVYASSSKSNEASFYQARAYLDFLSDKLHIPKLFFTPLNDQKEALPDNLAQLAGPFDLSRSALISTKEVAVGIVGEFNAQTNTALKLPIVCSGFEIDMTSLEASGVITYHKLSKFPSIKQDMTLKVPANVSYGDLALFINQELAKRTSNEGNADIELLSVYRPKEDESSTNYAFRAIITDYEKTLVDSEVNKMLDEVALSSKDKFGAERI